jgi:CRP/FNR family transcriptional regulator, cyclic AMP receptor protein
MEKQKTRQLNRAEPQNLKDTIPFFKGLSEESLKLANSHVVTRSHPANRVIMLENDWGGSVYFILEGWVKIRTHNLEGKEVTLNIVGQGEVIGEMAALEEVPRSTDALTLAPTTISSIPAQDFVKISYWQSACAKSIDVCACESQIVCRELPTPYCFWQKDKERKPNSVRQSLTYPIEN